MHHDEEANGHAIPNSQCAVFQRLNKCCNYYYVVQIIYVQTSDTPGITSYLLSFMYCVVGKFFGLKSQLQH